MESPFDGLVFDAEISLCIPPLSGYFDPKYRYCSGWSDYEKMGISVICAWDLATDMPHIFMRDNLQGFINLVSRRQYVIGFNSKRFDDFLCAANNIRIQTTYDLMEEVLLAAGIRKPFMRGYGLGNIAESTLGITKSGDGELAPCLYQDGRYGELVDYCMRDVVLTKNLFYMRNHIIDPTTGNRLILRSLFEAKHGGSTMRMEFDYE